jgi:hypothetical protein
MTRLTPQADGVPLPAGTRVFRIGKDVHLSKAAKDRREAMSTMFELSSEDKASDIPRLSLYIEELTIADQAWDFLGRKPENTVVACLSADDIRKVHADQVVLDIQWHAKMIEVNGEEILDTRPGASGHVGIPNLDKGSKAARKNLRSQLAEAARVSPVPVPHDLDENEIRQAAAQICRTTPQVSDVENWISAIRQLRRARVTAENVSS